jgi:AcrR family transcriptional regulator
MRPARILLERGFAAASTNAVAELAGVSVGSLYQYFPNKEALIAALHARHGEQMMQVIQRALTEAMDATLDDALSGLIEATVEAHRVDADLHRVLEQQLGHHDREQARRVCRRDGGAHRRAARAASRSDRRAGSEARGVHVDERVRTH